MVLLYILWLKHHLRVFLNLRDKNTSFYLNERRLCVRLRQRRNGQWTNSPKILLVHWPQRRWLTTGERRVSRRRCWQYVGAKVGCVAGRDGDKEGDKLDFCASERLMVSHSATQAHWISRQSLHRGSCLGSIFLTIFTIFTYSVVFASWEG